METYFILMEKIANYLFSPFCLVCVQGGAQFAIK